MIIALKDEGRPSSDPGGPSSGQWTPLPRRASTWGRPGSDRATCGPDARDDQRSLTVHRGSSAARDLHICNATPSQVDHYRSSKLVMRLDTFARSHLRPLSLVPHQVKYPG